MSLFLFFSAKVYLARQCDGFAVNGLHTGQIFSHASGSLYQSNTECTVLFHLPPDHLMQFTFEHFELQTRVRGRCEDSVQFFVGPVLDQPLSEPFCGHKIPNRILTNHSHIGMRFRTNHALEGSGFQLRFKRIKLRNLRCHPDDIDCNKFVTPKAPDPAEHLSSYSVRLGEELGEGSLGTILKCTNRN